MHGVNVSVIRGGTHMLGVDDEIVSMIEVRVSAAMSAMSRCHKHTDVIVARVR